MATIYGDLFSNTLDANDGVTNGNDTIYGYNGNDNIYGLGGDDVIWGGNGWNYLNGGSGTDTAVYLDAGIGVSVDLAWNVAAHGAIAQDDELVDIENVVGSLYGDWMYGDDEDNVLMGDFGDDELSGDDGDDTLIGGIGADALDGNSGIDTASYAGALTGVAASLASGTGSMGEASGDTFEGIENLTGSYFADTLTGDAGANTLDGSGSDDELKGGGGADTLIGGTGTDTASYIDSVAGVTVNLDPGAGFGGSAEGDTLSEIENLGGSLHADNLTGGSGANRLFGSGGDDTLKGGGGADTLDGSSGVDTATYTDSTAGVTVNLLAGSGDGGTAEGDTLIAVENLTGSWHADTLIGDEESNRISGLVGDDWLKGGGGADTLDGGDGNDTATYLNYGGGVTVSLGTGTGSGSAAQGDVLIDIENLYGTVYADTLIGDAGANVLHGEGDDDTLQGEGGADRLIGSSGADRLIGGSETDSATYVGSTAGVIVNLTTGTGSGGEAEGDRLTGIENLVGSAHADILAGDAQANVLAGEGGYDTLWGGAGADALDGGGGIDTAIYTESTSGVTVDLLTGSGSGGTADGDTLTGIENLLGSAFNDGLTGDSNDNLLNGSLGDDELAGNGGADILVGGNGADTMSGGSGGDAFVWIAIENAGTTVDAADTISDFDFAQGDRINLAGIDANAYVSGNQAFAFVGTGAFTLDATTGDPTDVVPGEIRYYHADGDTFIELQTGTSADVEGVIRLTGIHTPEASWFIL